MAFGVSGSGGDEVAKLEACRAYARMMNTMSDKEDNWVGTLLIKMEGSLRRSMCMCVVPLPHECKRTFARPGAGE
jgi:hypothetical protein